MDTINAPQLRAVAEAWIAAEKAMRTAESMGMVTSKIEKAAEDAFNKFHLAMDAQTVMALLQVYETTVNRPRIVVAGP